MGASRRAAAGLLRTREWEMGRNMVITIRAFMWTAVLSVFAFGAAHAQDIPKGDAKAGLAGYQKFGCYSCHGIVGQGTLRDGPRLNAAALGYPAILAQLRTPRYEMPCAPSS